MDKKTLDELFFDNIAQRQNELGKNYTFSKSKFFYGKFNIKKEVFEIKTKKESEFWDKDKGIYQLISINNVLEISDQEKKYYISYLSKIIKKTIKRLMNRQLNDLSLLVVGLGNREISADSLGSEVVNNINVTRNIIPNNLVDNFPTLSAIAPSVLGKTGIETADIIDAVCEKIKPDMIIIIDSLCASAVSRLGKSVQISTTALVPGAGVNNHRKKITAPKVISIGVPLVIYSKTYISEFVENTKIYEFLKDFKNNNSQKNINFSAIENFFNNFNKFINNQTFNEIVTIQDINQTTKILSNIISESINKALFGNFE